MLAKVQNITITDAITAYMSKYVIHSCCSVAQPRFSRRRYSAYNPPAVTIVNKLANMVFTDGSVNFVNNFMLFPL